MSDHFDAKVLRASLIVLAVGALALVLWVARGIVLLSFGGGLLAVGLVGLARQLARLGLPYGLALALVVILLAGGALLGGYLIVPALAGQFEELFQRLIAAWEALEQQLHESAWGQQLIAALGDENGELRLPLPGLDALGQLTSTFAITVGALANVLFVLFMALFLAADPARYREGVLALVPPAGRQRARQIWQTITTTLRNWLKGTLISMLVVGSVAWLGLRLLGVPLALPLALIIGLFEFIPLVGPILGSIPALLVAFVSSPLLALYVLIFYVALQQLEGNLLTPLVQQQAVALPPALTLVAILLFGLLLGPLGYLFATPLAAVIVALIRALYLNSH